jgi:hypothetical protein
MRFCARHSRFTMTAAVVLVLAGSAWAAGIRDHNQGFFLRLSAGGGSASTELDLGPNLKMSGGMSDVNIAIGGIVSPNLALHATIFGWVVSDPDVKFVGRSAEASGDLDLSALGIGLTYYFMPANFYISGSVGGGSLSLDVSTGEGETDTGPVLDLTVGKEWWVSDGWGLGAALAVGYHSVPEKDIDENWTGTSFAVRFSATFN